MLWVAHPLACASSYHSGMIRRLLLITFVASVAFAQAPRFEVSFPTSAHAGPITGRVFIVLAQRESPEPIRQAGSWTGQTPFFGTDVDALQPGHDALIDSSTAGFPAASLKDVRPGDYYVQAIANVYTQFHRADGHTIWAHMDQWEGQQFTRSPGNLYSDVRKVHLDPSAGYDVRLELTKVIPPIDMPADTQYVKHVKIQ